MIPFREFLISKKSEKTLTTERWDTVVQTIKDTTSHLSHLEEARDILSTVGILAYKEIKDVIEDLVTQSLQSVFGENYSFELDNRISRNKPETYMYVIIDGKRRSLKDEQGGGIADLVAFSLRVVLWALSGSGSDNVMILDEPLRFVDKKHLVTCGEMIKKLSEMLDLQFILVTHEEELMDAADKSYLVTQVDGVSIVEEIVN